MTRRRRFKYERCWKQFVATEEFYANEVFTDYCAMVADSLRDFAADHGTPVYGPVPLVEHYLDDEERYTFQDLRTRKFFMYLDVVKEIEDATSFNFGYNVKGARNG